MMSACQISSPTIVARLPGMLRHRTTLEPGPGLNGHVVAEFEHLLNRLGRRSNLRSPDFDSLGTPIRTSHPPDAADH